MRSKNWIFKEVNTWLGNPADWNKNPDHTRLKMIWAGVIKEYNPDVSLPELAKASGVKSHSTPMEWLEGWNKLPWTTRHAWLEFFMGTNPKRLYTIALSKDPVFKYVKNP